jgi:glycosyltransferase involved in cell wall biosynthesis
LIIYGNLETLTGGYLYDRILVERLREYGDEVEVISLPLRSYARSLSDNFSRSLLRRLCRSRFDVLLQDELCHPSLFRLNLRLKKRVGYPLMTIVHLLRGSESRPAWQNRFYRRVERNYLLSVNGIVCNSRTTRVAVEELMGAKPPSIVAYPAGDHLRPSITPEQMLARAQKDGPLRLLFLANVIPGKGPHVLIEALSQLPPESWHLTIVGSLTTAPDYVRSIRRQIAQHQLDSRVKMTGTVPNKEVAGHLAESDVLAVPSFYEAFGIASLEALGHGLPVIATSAGATHEIITHGREGFLVAPGDVGSIKKYVRELSENRERLREMSRAACERYSAHPTWAESISRIRAFMQTLVNA